MSATASDSNSYQPANTNGLDDLFEKKDEDQVQFQDHVVSVEFQDQNQLEQLVDHVELVPLSQAAKILGITRRYAHKMATQGKLWAKQDNRGRWFVRLDQGKVQFQDHVESVEFQDQNQVEQIQDHLEPDQFSDFFSGQERVIEEQREQIKGLQQKLESATYRVGYLQHQIETQDQQIKLLTDSQHKRMWTRFCEWFFGGAR